MTTRPAHSASEESLTAEDLGIPLDARAPFTFSPGQTWSPLVLSLPHVGLSWPAELRPKPQADIARNADYEVQRLYRGASALGVASVTAIYSRLVVDLNRADDDIARSLVPDHPAPRPRRVPGDPNSTHPAAHEPERAGRGVVWTHAVGNVRVLEGPMRYAAFSERIRRYHTPYYRALEILLERRRERFGFAILLDAHSMPSSVGIDLVLGTQGGDACDPAIARVAHEALGPDLSPVAGAPSNPTIIMRRDFPYQGGQVVRRFGRPHQDVHALQLEVSRALYMDEVSFQLHEDAEARRLSTHLGTDRASGRGSGSRAGAQTPTPRQQLSLADLQRRVRCLVTALAGISRDDLTVTPTVARCADQPEGHPDATGAGRDGSQSNDASRDTSPAPLTRGQGPK